MGWERSALRWPTSDEFAFPGGRPDRRPTARADGADGRRHHLHRRQQLRRLVARRRRPRDRPAGERDRPMDRRRADQRPRLARGASGSRCTPTARGAWWSA